MVTKIIVSINVKTTIYVLNEITIKLMVSINVKSTNDIERTTGEAFHLAGAEMIWKAGICEDERSISFKA